MKIKDAILERWYDVRDRMAYAIQDGDWTTLLWYIGLVLAVVLAALALGVGVLALIWKAFGTVLGKIFAVLLVLFIFGKSYQLNFEDSRKARQAERDIAELNRWATQVYGYVRDSMYYVLQNLADRANIIKPNVPSDIEMGNKFFRQNGHIVFQFYVELSKAMDKAKFEEKLTATLFQMHRDGRLVGIASDLVEINNLPYCPLQVLNVEQYDDGFTFQIVFADEETIPLVERGQQRNRKRPGKNLFDDDI